MSFPCRKPGKAPQHSMRARVLSRLEGTAELAPASVLLPPETSELLKVANAVSA